MIGGGGGRPRVGGFGGCCVIEHCEVINMSGILYVSFCIPIILSMLCIYSPVLFNYFNAGIYMCMEKTALV